MNRSGGSTATATISRGSGQTRVSAVEKSTASPLEAINASGLTRQRSYVHGLAAIALNYIVIGSCVVVSEALDRSYDQTTARVCYCIAILAIASRLRGFENLVHEASHHNLFPSNSLHYTLEFLYAYPVFKDLGDYRRSHMAHHKYLGDIERDPDAQRLKELKLDDLTERPASRLAPIILSGWLTLEWIQDSFASYWSPGKNLPAKAAYWLSVLSAAWHLNSLHLLAWYYVAPLLLVLPISRFWAELAEHAGLDMRHTVANSRTNTGTIHRWYLHPHNDGFHAVHHLSPQVPFYELPKAHELLLERSPAYKQAVVVSSGFMDTLTQMCSKPTGFQDAKSQKPQEQVAPANEPDAQSELPDRDELTRFRSRTSMRSGSFSFNTAHATGGPL